MKTAVKHCVSSAYQIGTGGGVEGRRGLAPPPIRLGARRSYRRGLNSLIPAKQSPGFTL